MRSSIYVETFDSNSHTSLSPLAVAAETANKILAYRNGHSATDRPINIFLKNFGRDANDHDYDDNGSPTNWEYPTRFFRVEDRLLDPITHSPRQDQDLVANGQDWTLVSTARWYRHPFLKNAGPSAPMRQWMIDYVAALKDLLDDMDPACSPERFYFDTEPFMAYPMAAPALRILRTLMLDSQGDLWHTPIPAWENKTLIALYQDELARQQLEFGAAIWPSDPAQAAALIQINQDSSQLSNRSYMRWWYELTQRVEDYVMFNCAYDVIHSGIGWPEQNSDGSFKVRCGNYDDMLCDGGVVTGQAGWHYDRASVSYDNYWNLSSQPNPAGLPDNPAVRVLTKTMPRVYQELNWGGPMYFTGTGANQRWLAWKTWATGDVDSPYFYAIDHPTGPYAPGIEGMRQNDAYGVPDASGTFPVESEWQTDMRAFRQRLEAIINSGAGGRETRVVPWVEMVASPDLNQSWPSIRTPLEFRQLISLLRSKNLAEFQAWTNWPLYGADGHALTPEERQQQVNIVWNATGAEIPKVYATRITRYQRISVPGVTQPPDDGDVNRLEFTLLRPDSAGNQVPRVVSLRSDSTSSTQLYVDVKFNDDALVYKSSYGLDISIEGSGVQWSNPTAAASFTGQAMAYNFALGRWDTLRHDTGNGQTTYASYLPDGAFRTHYVIPGGVESSYVGTGGAYLNKLRLRFVQSIPANSVTGDLLSQYDLVQVVPGEAIQTGSGSSLLTLAPAVLSDFNFDGVTDQSDLDGFVENWFMGTQPADVDMNEAVDEDDLGTFLDAYVTGE